MRHSGWGIRAGRDNLNLLRQNESFWACRECILAEAEARQKCPLCRAGITAEGLREGVTPGDDEVIGQARQGSGAQGDEEAPGPFAQGHPGAPNQPHILSESKLNVLLKEVSLSWTSMPFHVALRVCDFSFHPPKAPMSQPRRSANFRCPFE